MEMRFNKERIRFHMKEKDTLVIQGWFEGDAEGKELFSAALDGRELPLAVTVQRGVEVTKKYLRYRTNVMAEYFLNISLPEGWQEARTLQVYHLVGQEGRNSVYHASGASLGKLSRHLESWMEKLTELPDGRYQLRGWYMGCPRAGVALLDGRGRPVEAECRLMNRSDILGEFPEAELSDTHGFELTFPKPEENFLRLALKGSGKRALYTVDCRKMLSGREGLANLCRKSYRYLKRKGFRQFTKRVSDVLFGADSITYERWRKKYGTSRQELERQRGERFAWEPKVSIVVPLYRTPERYLRELIRSVECQTYGNWELVLSDGSGADSLLYEAVGRAARCRVEMTEVSREEEQEGSGLARPEAEALSEREGRGGEGSVRAAREACQRRASRGSVSGSGDRAAKIRVLRHPGALRIAENTNAALQAATGDLLAFCDHDDLLSPDALYECVKFLNGHPGTELLYSDEDKVDGTGRQYFQPHFKPDYNPDLLCSMNYFCHLVAVRRELFARVGGLDPAFEGAQDYDFVLRCTEQAGPSGIGHIPKILYHWRSHRESTSENPESKRYAFEAGRRAIEAHYGRLGIRASVREGQYPGLYETEYEIQGEPLVSILIPNKDHREDLQKCLRSIEGQSDYRNYEFIIIENNSTEPETFAYYRTLQEENPKAKVVTWQGEFNFSAINNFGADYAAGEYYLLLNNDTEMLRPDGIRQLLGPCQREDVGAVGALLYYEDDVIQHAGVVLGFGGIAGHAFIGSKRGDNGYFSRIICQQDYSAVTAACMMVKASVYREAGGMSEELKVAFNDIDFCMKIGRLGKRVVYNPQAELYHYESKSRGLENTQEKIERFNQETAWFLAHWGDKVEAGDPCYSPNLSLDKADFSLRT